MVVRTRHSNLTLLLFEAPSADSYSSETMAGPRPSVGAPLRLNDSDRPSDAHRADGPARLHRYRDIGGQTPRAESRSFRAAGSTRRWRECTPPRPDAAAACRKQTAAWRL